MSFTLTIPLRWSDFDINQHVKHCAYGEYCTQARLELLNSVGCDLATLIRQYQITPVLLEENCQYLQELTMKNTSVIIETRLVEFSEDHKKYRFMQEVMNRERQVCAVLKTFGAWLHFRQRKIISLPAELLSKFQPLLD